MIIFSTQELVASKPTQVNWKGIIIALVVIIQVIGLVILAVYLMTPHDPWLELGRERMQRKDVERDKFRERRCNVSWISGRRSCDGSVLNIIVRRSVPVPDSIWCQHLPCRDS